MHGGSGSGPSKKARIEIIPLIDVIFFLLATFVLFTLSLNKTQGVPVALPETKSGNPRDNAEVVTISITKEGTLHWNKDAITLEEFLIRLQSYSSQPEPKIIINGDSGAAFGQARYVLDEIRKAKIREVSFDTRQKPPE